MAIPLLGIYPNESKSPYYRDTYRPMFTMTLSTTSKLWNQARCPSKDKCTRMWFKGFLLNY